MGRGGYRPGNTRPAKNVYAVGAAMISPERLKLNAQNSAWPWRAL